VLFDEHEHRGRHGAHYELRDDHGIAVAGGLAVDDGEEWAVA
jgi:hypothetical protein